MGWTKNDIIAQAFAEIGLPVEVFNVGAERMNRALRQLDAMMATWQARGIHVGYMLPSGPDNSSLDDESGLPDVAVETVYLNLAIRIAPGRGKVVSPETKANAAQGFEGLLVAAAQPPQQQFRSTLPLGAGNKPWRTSTGPFMPVPVDPFVVTENGAPIEYE